MHIQVQCAWCVLRYSKEALGVREKRGCDQRGNGGTQCGGLADNWRELDFDSERDGKLLEVFKQRRMWSYIGLERMLLKFHQGWKQGDRRGGGALIQMRDHGDWVSSGKQSGERWTNSEDALGVEPRTILTDQMWSWEKRRTRRVAWVPGKLVLPSTETGRALQRTGLRGKSLVPFWTCYSGNSQYKSNWRSQVDSYLCKPIIGCVCGQIGWGEVWTGDMNSGSTY